MPIDQNRGFALFAAGQGLSHVGSSMIGFGIGVYVFEASDSAAAYGTYLAAGAVGAGVGPLFVGGMVDRLPRRRLLIGFDTVAALVSVLVLAAVAVTSGDIYVLSALAFLGGMNGTAHYLTLQTIIPGLVAKGNLLRANATLSLIGAFAQIVGPSLGALVFVWIALEGLVAIDLATYAVAIGTIAVIRISPTAKSDAKSHAILANLLFGARWIHGCKPLRNLLAYSLLLGISYGVATVLAAPMILTTDNEQVLGAMLSTSAVGGVLGSIVTMRISIRKRQRAYLLLGSIQALALASIAAGRSPGFYAAGGLLFFFASSITQSLNDTNWQARTPSEIRGRVFAVRTALGYSITPLTYVSVGALAESWRATSPTDFPALVRMAAPVVGVGAEAPYAAGFLAASVLVAILVIVVRLTNGLAALDETEAA